MSKINKILSLPHGNNLFVCFCDTFNLWLQLKFKYNNFKTDFYLFFYTYRGCTIRQEILYRQWIMTCQFITLRSVDSCRISITRNQLLSPGYYRHRAPVRRTILILPHIYWVGKLGNTCIVFGCHKLSLPGDAQPGKQIFVTVKPTIYVGNT